MYGGHTLRKNSTVATRATCAVLFCAFSFSWLFWFQADVLSVAQHVLSNGVTRYDCVVGALLITLVLLMLQQLIASVVKLYRRAHALTFLPSMLLLAIISDVSPDIDQHFTMGAWYWVSALLLIVWGGMIWVAKEVPYFESSNEHTSFFSRRVWISVLVLFVMMLFVVSVANTNAVFHYRCHAETALERGDVDEALRVGKNSLETDETLTMLRIYALSLRYELGEKLFEYPLAGHSTDILPVAGSRSRLMLLNADRLWKHLGARPAPSMLANYTGRPVARKSSGVERYLNALQRDTMATSAVADYLLCGHLIDRDIDAFVRDLPIYYPVSDSLIHQLPRHYREALTLYTHLRSKPVIVYHHAVMDEDWANLQELEKKYADARERKGMVYERYSESYWYYYFYQSK